MGALTAGIIAAGMIGAAAGKALKPVLNPKEKPAAMPELPTLPEPIDAKEEKTASEAEATRARMRQRTESQQRQGRRSTILTTPDTLGQATVQRKTLLGI